jgi:hypothetical protein
MIDTAAVQYIRAYLFLVCPGKFVVNIQHPYRSPTEQRLDIVWP